MTTASPKPEGETAVTVRRDQTSSGIETFGIPIDESAGLMRLGDLRELVEATAALPADATAAIHPAELLVSPRDPDA